MRSILLLLSLAFSISNLQAQILEPVTWDISFVHLQDDEFELIYQAKIDDNWIVYSQFTPDDGPVPTSITYESEGFVKLGNNIEEGHKKEGFDKIFEIDVIKFLSDQPYIIKQKVKAANGTEISGFLTYMTCNNAGCLPPTDVDFSLKLVGSPSDYDRGTVPNETKGEVIESGTEILKTSSTKDHKISKRETPSTEKTVNSKNKGTISTEAAKNPKTKIVNLSDSKDDIQQNDLKIGNISVGDSQVKPEESSVNGLLNPVSWNMEIKPIDGNVYEIKYTATIQDPWTVYSQFTSDEGPIPTLVTYETTEVEQLGKGIEVGHRKEGMDKVFEIEVIKFLADEPFVITHKIKSSAAQIKGYLTFMTCDNERCLPPTDVDFAFDLKSGTQIGYDEVGAELSAPMTSTDLVNKAGPNIVGQTLDNKIPAISASYTSPLGDCKGGEEKANSLFGSFLFGLIGGLIALLTPCVFPMIPLTVSFFTKDTKRRGWVNGLIYGISIIVIYVTLGLALTAIFGDEALNRLSTNWIANTMFFLIFLFFAFSFFGYYEITLPSSWSTKSDTMVDKGGLLGIFFMAFTLALVSFSCTGPIIGTAIVQAASNAVGPAVVMAGFGLGLALPFGVFAAVPALLNSLPRSGGWMNSVKVVLGFLELALAFKFLSVADMTNHWGFLKYELFMGIWILTFAGMTAYLFGWIKFPHDSPVKKLSPGRMAFAIVSLIWTIYLVTGLVPNKEQPGNYNSLALMSGLAPPSTYNFFLKQPDADKSIKQRYPSYTLCANNIPCFKDYYEGKAYAQEINKPIFLDFTGYGCVNCRKTEEHIWVDFDIKEKLIKDFVLVSLYVDDDKKLDKVYMSKHRDNKKIRNVGNMWADFQIINFQQNSQPLYVMMTPDEKVMAKPRGYKEGIGEYKEYLECGLTTYDGIQN